MGLEFLDLVSVCWKVGPVPDMAGCEFWGVPKGAGPLVSGLDIRIAG